MAANESPVAGKRCLVLDDEFLIALDIQQIFEAAGAAEVVCAANAADALTALDDGGRFDFAVLDVNLDGNPRSSLTVAAALAERKIPFVFLTGMRAADVRSPQFANVPVVEKPYETPRLMDAVLRALTA